LFELEVVKLKCTIFKNIFAFEEHK